MTTDRNALMLEMDQMREELWGLVDALDPKTEIYPGWNKRDFVAHIAGWEAFVFEFFKYNAQEVSLKPYPYDNLKNLDEANAHFVAERQSSTLEGVKLECEISRYAIKRMMNDISDDDFDKKLMQFPWGNMTVAQFVRDAIIHERDHADDIRKLK
jgi:hypothetical protein